MTETWLPIPGHEGAYEVSDLGRVKSLRHSEPRLMACTPCKVSGYPTTNIAGKTWRVHRLVLLAFVGPRPAGLVSRHRDDVKTNNALTNLVYGTQAENNGDTVANGHHLNVLKDRCPRGHYYSPSNTRWKGRRRSCRQCQRLIDLGRQFTAYRWSPHLAPEKAA